MTKKKKKVHIMFPPVFALSIVVDYRGSFKAKAADKITGAGIEGRDGNEDKRRMDGGGGGEIRGKRGDNGRPMKSDDRAQSAREKFRKIFTHYKRRAQQGETVLIRAQH